MSQVLLHIMNTFINFHTWKYVLVGKLWGHKIEEIYTNGQRINHTSALDITLQSKILRLRIVGLSTYMLLNLSIPIQCWNSLTHHLASTYGPMHRQKDFRYKVSHAHAWIHCQFILLFWVDHFVKLSLMISIIEKLWGIIVEHMRGTNTWDIYTNESRAKP